MPSKSWQLASPAALEDLNRYDGLSPVLAQVLYNRGQASPEEAVKFLSADGDDQGQYLVTLGQRCSPLHKAIARIRQAIRGREPIVVYGDFDADGVTSTVLLVQVLTALGAEVKPYIPHRVDEGYGLNAEALRTLAQDGAKLVITVDCGIRSIEEVNDGNARGLDIIVTDHHTLGSELPDAYAVINPKCDGCRYSEPMLAGVGVAFRLAEALLTTYNGQFPQNGAPPLQAEDLLDLVAIGTVADLAPLNRYENRMLVKRGLKVINDLRRPGLRALAKVADLEPGKISAMSIGFAIGPRINAAGRLDSAMLAYNLLASDDDDEALELAVRLNALNIERQDLTREAQEMIRTQLDAEPEFEAPLIFASDSRFRPGIVGLVAGRLTEEYYLPAIVMEAGEVESRASCRSIPQFDITRALDECADLLVRHGGHAQAAGFTVINENIPLLKARLLEIAHNQLADQDLQPTIEIDAELTPDQISMALAEELTLLEPTGHMNPTPVFATYGLRVIDSRFVGKENQHLKLRLRTPDGEILDAIGFRLAELAPSKGDSVDVAYTLDINEWNNTRSVQLNLQDIRPSAH